jgi:hypothetical protein
MGSGNDFHVIIHKKKREKLLAIWQAGAGARQWETIEYLGP